MPGLGPGEVVLAEAQGVRLGWQWQTILIWWVPGILFTALALAEFHSLLVAAGVLLFCLALFAFYASDREVRPRAGTRHYVLTNRRLLVVQPGGVRETELSDVAATQMEESAADVAVATLSAAATIVLQLRTPGPKGEPRRLRIGPLRRPREFRAAIDREVNALSGNITS